PIITQNNFINNAYLITLQPHSRLAHAHLARPHRARAKFQPCSLTTPAPMRSSRSPVRRCASLTGKIPALGKIRGSIAHRIFPKPAFFPNLSAAAAHDNALAYHGARVVTRPSPQRPAPGRRALAPLTAAPDPGRGRPGRRRPG